MFHEGLRESTYPETFTDNPQPVPAELSPALQLLEAEFGLHVLSGLSPELAKQLVVRSREEHIGETCPNDAPTRFKDPAAVERWLGKGRLALPLVAYDENESPILVGFGWMGPGEPGEDEPQIAGAKTTFAVRLYTPALKQGLAPLYTKAILSAHDAQFGSDGVWLEVWATNQRALEAYLGAGFRKVTRVPGKLHGKPVDRVYMTLEH